MLFVFAWDLTANDSSAAGLFPTLHNYRYPVLRDLLSYRPWRKNSFRQLVSVLVEQQLDMRAGNFDERVEIVIIHFRQTCRKYDSRFLKAASFPKCVLSLESRRM